MQNMPNSANSCRVYCLILEQNILVTVLAIFSIFSCHSPTPCLYPLSHPQYPSKVHTSHPSPLVPHCFQEDHFSRFPLEKVGGALQECLSYTTLSELSFGGLACTCSDSSPHRAQALCSPDSTEACCCQEAKSLAESGRLPWWTQGPRSDRFKCVLAGSVTSQCSSIYENECMPFCLEPKRRRPQGKINLFLWDGGRFVEEKVANVKQETLVPQTSSSHNLLLSFSPIFPQFPYLSEKDQIK